LKVIPFIANSAADAVAQIRAQLGPEAVVLNVRQVPATGLSRLWHSPLIEVIACLPDPAQPASPGNDLAELRQELATLKQQMPVPKGNNGAIPPSIGGDIFTASAAETSRRTDREYGDWRAGEALETMGLLPRYAQKLVDRLKTVHGQEPPASLSEEIRLVRDLLRQSWPQSPAVDPHGPSPVHVLIGAPGVGKTTSLCKWLAQSVLLENQTAQVLRLDGGTANTAQVLNIYCEILGVPVARDLSGGRNNAAVLFVDLPGLNPNDGEAMKHLAGQLATLPSPQVHLVLNSAYEMSVLLAQMRAFSSLPITDLILTHLDEERRWGKLLNLVLGTNYILRFLSAGQNIPGDFFPATADRLFAD
jgi:flagellar biosynthesis protein FlhF